MSGSKVSAKHYIVPKDIFYCIDFFAQPKNRPHTSTSANHAAPKLRLTIDAVSAIDMERKAENEVPRWLDTLPDRFSRVPGDSRSRVRAVQLEQLERERDREMANRMHLAQQSQSQPNDMGGTLEVDLNAGAKEYLRLIEPDRQELFEYWRAEARELKERRHKKNTEEQSNQLPGGNLEMQENGPRSREYNEMEEQYSAGADLPPANEPPPPIPPRSVLRPGIPTFSEAVSGSIRYAEPINAGSSQYSSVDVLPQEATTSGTSGVVRDLESGFRRDNPGLVAELRLGMERRRQREFAREEGLEGEREQETSKGKVWPLKLWK
ncbi:hypothetical protein V491_04860 [Pseudogymnoascus sp. VKM F-3775]|nr:hypothetical protein V491_04860 [Pseudogymnoascus sp. VKM F-3775]